jgi:hypothetical protein
MLLADPPQSLRDVNTSSTSSTFFSAIMLINRDRIYHDREDLTPVFKAGGKIYICGSPALAEGVKKVMVKIWCERKDESEEVGWKWLQGLGKERFATDVFV